MVDDEADDFYEEDEPIERIQEIRRRPPDFVTAPPRGVTVFLAHSSSGEWVEHSEPATWGAIGCR
jgi:hypothetical protein